MRHPSMTALLGLLAIAGYQNRDKIAELLRGTGQAGGAGGGLGGALGGLLGGLGGGRGGGGLGDLLGGLSGGNSNNFLGGALSEIVGRFKESGQGDVANSWVATGPNREISGPQLRDAIGPDVLRTLADKTGLTEEELVARLSRELPAAVDRYTPEGRLPG